MPSHFAESCTPLGNMDGYMDRLPRPVKHDIFTTGRGLMSAARDQHKTRKDTVVSNDMLCREALVECH